MTWWVIPTGNRAPPETKLSITLSRNLKLRIDSGLTANAKYNLERIDLLAANLTSTNLGSGTVSIGTDSHILTNFSVYASTINMSSPVGTLDQATGGDKYLRIGYKSDITGSVDTTADRALNIDLQGADRSLVLAGNLSTAGTGNLTLTLSANSTLTLPITGTLATLAGSEALSNKTSIGISNGTFQAFLQTSISQAADYTLTLPIDDGSSGQILTTNGAGVLSWSSAGSGIGDVKGFTGSWLNADGTTKVITHALASLDPEVAVIDDTTSEYVLIDSVVVTNSNSVTLVSSEAPSSSWRVVVQAKP